MKLLLIGNPNVGKSAIFTHLTGVSVVTSNYPGSTVSYTKGYLTVYRNTEDDAIRNCRYQAGSHKQKRKHRDIQKNGDTEIIQDDCRKGCRNCHRGRHGKYTENLETAKVVEVIDVPGTYRLDPDNDAERVAVKMLDRITSYNVCYTKLLRNPIVSHEYLGDNLEGKDVIIADDLIASGESILDVAKELKKRNANRIFAIVTFGQFTQGVEKFNEAYNMGYISRVYATNLSYRRPELLNAPWFVDVDMSKFMAYVIEMLNHNESLSPLADPSEKINKFLVCNGIKSYWLEGQLRILFKYIVSLGILNEHYSF